MERYSTVVSVCSVCGGDRSLSWTFSCLEIGTCHKKSSGKAVLGALLLLSGSPIFIAPCPQVCCFISVIGSGSKAGNLLIGSSFIYLLNRY